MMAILPQTRNLSSGDDLDAVESRMDGIMDEIARVVDSTAEHMDVLNGCKDRLRQMREQFAEARKGPDEEKPS
jgi:predicted  nucleic acid-binding Zn-ribbon protein